MVARSRLAFSSALLLSLTMTFSLGCAAEPTEEREGASALLETNDPGTDLVLASWDANRARQASDEKDAVLGRLLARVSPALDDAQQKAVIDAFEARKDVAEARGDYLTKSRALADKLEAIDRDPALARKVATEPGLLMAAYEQLAATPFSAGSIRFAGQLLAVGDDSPYANMKQLGQLDAHAAKLLSLGLTAALVERSVVHADIDDGLADLRAYLGDANGKAGVVLAVIADRKTLLARSELGDKLVVAGGDLAPTMRAMGGILAVWQAAEDVKSGNVAGLIKSGPDGIAALLEGTNALRRALGASKLVWAEDAAKTLGKLGAGIGVVMSAVGAIEGLRDLDGTDAKVRTLGNCLVLAGSVVALTGGSGALLIAAGTAATILADILEAPKPDDLRPLLAAAAAKGVISADAVEPLVHSRRENLQLLARDFELGPAEVLWTLVHAPAAAASEVDLYRSLSALHRLFGVRGATMSALLKAISSDKDAGKSRMRLSEFLRLTWDRSKVWGSRTQVLGELAAFPKDLRASDFDEDAYGIAPDTQLASTRAAIAAARAFLTTVH